ncbi:hypothetical protein [uncultured Salinisphaera sp.]|uniref:hypothetical protein n=1 Tax=uncultured Salinisphaera sp. TaxID=359372 RepID=UPI0032B2BFE6
MRFACHPPFYRSNIFICKNLGRWPRGVKRCAWPALAVKTVVCSRLYRYGTKTWDCVGCFNAVTAVGIGAHAFPGSVIHLKDPLLNGLFLGRAHNASSVPAQVTPTLSSLGDIDDRKLTSVAGMLSGSIIEREIHATLYFLAARACSSERRRLRFDCNRRFCAAFDSH